MSFPFDNQLFKILSGIIRSEKKEEEKEIKQEEKDERLRDERIRNEKKNTIKLKSMSTLPPFLTLDDNYEVLVLSGGGKKGIVQLGFLHCMYTNNKIDFSKIQAYIGTSVGSIISFLLIINILPVEILTCICSTKLDLSMNFLDLVPNFGVVDSERLFNTIEQITIEKIGFIPTMSELYELFEKEFICVTHNLSADPFENESETVYIDRFSHSDLSCIEAIRMSSNIPLIFGKKVYDKNFYIDGACSDNYAVRFANEKFPDKKILGIYTGRNFTVIKDDKKPSLMDYLRCLLDISYRKNCAKSCKYFSENLHSVMMTICEGNDEWKFNHSPSNNFQLFSIGYKCGNQLINSQFTNIDIPMRDIEPIKEKVD